ncbi:Fc receptor-like protein 6 isoform X5 [Pelodiscus sinensis]|uniref:Fc receptor-like protein 6 isoform X5 n=1 Tax=Pelodiscus sinensis TaxID=13735 RepID=UPI003F6D6F31
MPGRAMLLVLAFGLAAAAEKSTLTLDPPWKTVFRWERFTLTCSRPYTPGGSTLWHRNGKAWRSTLKNRITIEEAEMNDSGSYKCQAPGSHPSDPIELTVSYDWLILQVPYYAVFEGDPLLLRCCGWQGDTVSNIRFYKDGVDIRLYPENSVLTIKQARTSDSGKYHCSGRIKNTMNIMAAETSHVASISVQELFSSPVLKITGSGDVIEGNPVTLRCFTQLNSQKSDIQLLRVFYKDSMAPIGTGISPDYHIPAAGLEDSGFYHCEVKTMTLSVQKQSSKLKLDVKRIPVSRVSLGVQPQGGRVTEGEQLVLSCSVEVGTGPITFSWHQKGSRQALRTETQHSQRMVYEIPAANETDMGEYYCMASNGNPPASSPGVKIVVMVPVSGATITADPTGLEVMAGESMNLSCSVESGTAPLFKWLHNSEDLAAASGLSPPTAVGNMLHFRSVQLGHGGNYQCIASNQLSPQQVFQAHSKILAIAVIEGPSSQVAVAVPVSFLCVGVTAALVFYFKYWKKAGVWLRPLSVASTRNSQPLPSVSGSLGLAPPASELKMARSGRIPTSCQIHPMNSRPLFPHWLCCHPALLPHRSHPALALEVPVCSKADPLVTFGISSLAMNHWSRAVPSNAGALLSSAHASPPWRWGWVGKRGWEAAGAEAVGCKSTAGQGGSPAASGE